MLAHSMQKNLKWLLPPLFILLIAPFTPTIDLALARACYFNDGFSFNPLPFQLLFDYGEILGFGAGILSLILILLSFKKTFLQQYRAPCLAFLLTLVLGAGLITNLGFKQVWGRPRPKQLVEFGGNFEFRPYYKPNLFPKEKQKSFPSGHVAMGFSFLSFVFSFRRMQRKGLYYTALFITLSLGGGLVFARILQGGHFFSDVTFSIVLMWLIALFSDKWVFTSTKYSQIFALKEALPCISLQSPCAEEGSLDH